MALSADSNTAPLSESKDEIKGIIDEAKASGSYHGLSDAQQDILIKALQDHRNELQLSETTWPSVQLHNVRMMFSLIHHEVRYIQCSYSSSVFDSHLRSSRMSINRVVLSTSFTPSRALAVTNQCWSCY